MCQQCLCCEVERGILVQRLQNVQETRCANISQYASFTKITSVKFSQVQDRGAVWPFQVSVLMKTTAGSQNASTAAPLSDEVLCCPIFWVRLHSHLDKSLSIYCSCQIKMVYVLIFSKSQAFQKMHTALAKQSISRQMPGNVLKELLSSSPDFNR